MIKYFKTINKNYFFTNKKLLSYNENVEELFSDNWLILFNLQSLLKSLLIMKNNDSVITVIVMYYLN